MVNKVTRYILTLLKNIWNHRFFARQSRNQKKLNNRDTNYTNFHESLSAHEEGLAQIKQNIKT